MKNMNAAQVQAKLAELEAEYNTVKKEAARVPGLEKDLAEANRKVAALTTQVAATQKAAEAKAPALTEEQALKTAGLLVDRGLLKSEQKEAFADQIREDPSQLCASIEKIAEFAVAAQMGEPDESGFAMKVAELDPIARFALGE
jgi:hypothetical protein